MKNTDKSVLVPVMVHNALNELREYELQGHKLHHINMAKYWLDRALEKVSSDEENNFV